MHELASLKILTQATVNNILPSIDDVGWKLKQILIEDVIVSLIKHLLSLENVYLSPLVSETEGRCGVCFCPGSGNAR